MNTTEMQNRIAQDDLIEWATIAFTLLRQTIPFLQNHMVLTPNEGPADRILMEQCQKHIAKAKESFHFRS